MESLLAAQHALLMLFDGGRLLLLFSGVLLGLSLGLLPGIGGLAGLALLLPFTFTLDPYAAMALMLGLAATTATGDPIPAILFGVPGSAGSAATVLDGQPLAKAGQAGRALSAAYMSSMIGGIFGAVLMGLLLPFLAPTMLYIGSPEMLAFAILGISLVSTLAGGAPLKGLSMACLGLVLAMIGMDSQTGTMRWTFDMLYLWEGLPTVAVILGLFALPELADLAISRMAISNGAQIKRGELLEGAKDTFKHWWLVVRCSWIGSLLGAVPGIGGAVVDWVAYGHALKTEKGAKETFGKGDIRGVIASESANNAKEGGSLVPTVAFGIPGSAGMAVLMGAFIMHGLVPGPEMLNENLSVTYSMVWSIALANILGAGLCYLFSPQFSKLATLRYALIVPGVLCVVFIGAFQANRDWGDFFTLVTFGVIGWIMKHQGWSRPALVLGFVLGDLLERYAFISFERYNGLGWITRPVVVVLLTLALASILFPLWRGRKNLTRLSQLHFAPGDFVRNPSNLFGIGMLMLMVSILVSASGWDMAAKVVPTSVAVVAIAALIVSLLAQLLVKPSDAPAENDLMAATHSDGLPTHTRLARSALFMSWIVFFLLSVYVVGVLVTVPVFVFAYLKLEGRESWKLSMLYAGGMFLFVYGVFHKLLALPWPQPLL